jgi:hypothetical protein
MLRSGKARWFPFCHCGVRKGAGFLQKLIRYLSPITRNPTCKYRRFRKKSDICVTLQASSLQRTASALHSSAFASLDLKYFTKPPNIRAVKTRTNPVDLDYKYGHWSIDDDDGWQQKQNGVL